MTNILFEHPLNEKMRTWLRIEFLLAQLQGSRYIADHLTALTFFRNMGDLLDVFDRGELRTEMTKELERQQQKLLAWADVPGVEDPGVVYAEDLFGGEAELSWTADYGTGSASLGGW